jgi:hypothetical protein
MTTIPPAPGSIIPYPNQELLKAEVEKLRIELSMLVLEKDELLLVECKNIEMRYMLLIGGLEYQAFELECAVLRLKRKAELIQALKNRQEKILILQIEEALDLEFAGYREKLNAQMDRMNAAIEWDRIPTLSEDDTKELKKLYRAIVKALHPDLHPEQGEERLRLFYNAVTAYENGDLNGMRIISILIADPSLDAVRPDGLALLIKEKTRLTGLVERLRALIAGIRQEYPYIMKPLIQSPEKVQQRQAELKAGIREWGEALAAWKAKIEELLGERHG